MKNNSVTFKVAKKMVDHTLRNGWDQELGGIYDGGYYFQGEENATILRNTKEWWSQVDALNSFLMMSDLFSNDVQQYYEKFCIQFANMASDTL